MPEESPTGPIEEMAVEKPTETSKPAKESWLNMPLAIVIAGIFIAGAIVLTKAPATTDAAANAGGSAAVTADTLRKPSEKDHIIGSASAPVVIVEFADFQCPYCSVIYPSLKKIVEDSNGQIAWVFRNLPLESIHPEARPAAEAAECIAGILGNDAYWKFMEDDFANQKNIGDAWFTAEAAKLGANLAEFNTCVTQKKYDTRIDTDLSEAIQLGANGTPFTIIVPKTGRAVPFSGALPYSQIKAIVSSVISKAGTGTSQ